MELLYFLSSDAATDTLPNEGGWNVESRRVETEKEWNYTRGELDQIESAK